MAAAATDKDLNRAKITEDSKSCKDKSPAELFVDISFWLASQHAVLDKTQKDAAVKNIHDEVCKLALPLFKKQSESSANATAMPARFIKYVENYLSNPIKFNFNTSAVVPMYAMLSESIRQLFLIEYNKATNAQAIANSAAAAGSPNPLLFMANASAAANTNSYVALTAAQQQQFGLNKPKN